MKFFGENYLEEILNVKGASGQSEQRRLQFLRRSLDNPPQPAPGFIDDVAAPVPVDSAPAVPGVDDPARTDPLVHTSEAPSKSVNRGVLMNICCTKFIQQANPPRGMTKQFCPHHKGAGRLRPGCTVLFLADSIAAAFRRSDDPDPKSELRYEISPGQVIDRPEVTVSPAGMG